MQQFALELMLVNALVTVWWQHILLLVRTMKLKVC
jgi:hypothetical protein